MSTSNKPLARLLFAQGGRCFFCDQHLAPGEASVEHLLATSIGGRNADENCVACCKPLNALLGSMSLKEKLRVVLNQQGHFKCPAPSHAAKARPPAAAARDVAGEPVTDDDPRLTKVVENLSRRATARPRTLKTLTSTIGALFKPQLAEGEVVALIERLQARGLVVVAGTKVSYNLPPRET